MEFVLYLVGTIILGVIGSIIGNFLTPYTKSIFKWPEPKETASNNEVADEEAELEPVAEITPDDKERIRKRNRERITALSQLIFLYGYTFFVLFISFYSPIGFGLLGDNAFPLSETRLYWLCEGCAFTKENQTHISAISALILYYPAWIIAQKLGVLAERVIDNFTKLTSTQYTLLLVGIFFVISLFIAGNWVYLLYPKFTYLEAIGMPFFVIFVGMLIILANKDKH